MRLREACAASVRKCLQRSEEKEAAEKSSGDRKRVMRLYGQY